MLDKTKCDEKLGAEINKHLIVCGVETPVVINNISHNEKISMIEAKFQEIMHVLGLDLNDDSLVETPKRVAKMLVQETMWGLNYTYFPKCTTVKNKMNYDEMVVERNISVQSNCEHHFLPIVGNATVAYIPSDRVLGLSKIPRVVEFFSRRPQIQERLTEQIFHALAYILGTNNIAVVIDAEHLCVSSRGVSDINASTVTSKLGGAFKSDPALRAEFMRMISLDEHKK